MKSKEATIRRRLEDILHSILCPTSGCWYMHGCQYAYYHDESDNHHVLEVWPTGFQPPEEVDANRVENDADSICHELAEFEFSEVLKTVPLEYFHFSQRRELFEIGWKEDGSDLELRVHIVPMEVQDD